MPHASPYRGVEQSPTPVSAPAPSEVPPLADDSAAALTVATEQETRPANVSPRPLPPPAVAPQQVAPAPLPSWPSPIADPTPPASRRSWRDGLIDAAPIGVPDTITSPLDEPSRATAPPARPESPCPVCGAIGWSNVEQCPTCQEALVGKPEASDASSPDWGLLR